MEERRVTLADIAAKAAVHVTTVSLALRNHPRLPEATRQRIQALAEELGYRPDPMLRALVAYRGRAMDRRNTPTLAYVTNWATRWGWKKVTAHPSRPRSWMVPRHRRRGPARCRWKASARCSRR